MSDSIVNIDITEERVIPIPVGLTQNYTVILIIILFALLVIFIIMIGINRVAQENTFPDSTDITNVQLNSFYSDDIGMKNLPSNPSCPYPWTGNKCQIEMHRAPYYALGNITPNILPSENIIDQVYTSSKSLSPYFQTTCSDLCQEYEDCTGFYYENHECYLLNRMIISGDLSYNPTVNPNLYVKRGEYIILPQRLFLSQGISNLPHRYWRGHQAYPKYRFTEITLNAVMRIKFPPTFFKNHFTDFTGIISPYQFTAGEVPFLVPTENQERYLSVELSSMHNTGEITLPEKWQNKKEFYVYFWLS